MEKIHPCLRLLVPIRTVYRYHGIQICVLRDLRDRDKFKQHLKTFMFTSY